MYLVYDSVNFIKPKGGFVNIGQSHNMDSILQHALITGDKSFFDKIKDKSKIFDICKKYTMVSTSSSFFSTSKSQCILSFAGSFKQFELCQFLLMNENENWRIYTEPLLFKPTLSLKNEL